MFDLIYYTGTEKSIPAGLVSVLPPERRLADRPGEGREMFSPEFGGRMETILGKMTVDFICLKLYTAKVYREM
jgi:hypothetical protein